MKKRVVLLIHEYSEIHKNIIWDLKTNGFEVTFLLYHNRKINYRSKHHRIKQLIRKFLLFDKTYKSKLFNKYLESDYLNLLKTKPDNNFDYSLIIRADLFSTKVLGEVKRVSKLNISYHWDGMDRFTKIHEKVQLFDKFYIFDKNDFIKYYLKYPNLILTSNFYFKHNRPNNNYNKVDVFYIGAYVENRWDDIYEIYEKLKELNLNIKILIHGAKKEIIKKYSNQSILFFSTLYPYHETLEMTRNSKIVLDFKLKGNQGHGGLSLRFFEALLHQNKIITNNINVKKHDFYKKENIFIINHDNYDTLHSFINSPYQPISNTIKEKYSFINWFNSITK